MSQSFNDTTAGVLPASRRADRKGQTSFAVCAVAHCFERAGCQGVTIGKAVIYECLSISKGNILYSLVFRIPGTLYLYTRLMLTRAGAAKAQKQGYTKISLLPQISNCNKINHRISNISRVI